MRKTSTFANVEITQLPTLNYKQLFKLYNKQTILSNSQNPTKTSPKPVRPTLKKRIETIPRTTLEGESMNHSINTHKR